MTFSKPAVVTSVIAGDILESAANAEFADKLAVAVDVLGSQVLQQTALTTDLEEQPAARVIVVRMHLEVLGKSSNRRLEKSDLDLRRPGIGLMRLILRDHSVFLFFKQSHALVPAAS